MKNEKYQPSSHKYKQGDIKEMKCI